MRRGLVLLLLCGCSGAAPEPAASGVRWVTAGQAKASGKPVFVFFTAAGDDLCAAFESEVLSHDEVLHFLEPFACVRRDAFPAGGGRDAEFERLGFGGIPAIAFLSAAGEALDTREYGPERHEFLRIVDAVLEKTRK
jgi:hypothetical protein